MNVLCLVSKKKCDDRQEKKEDRNDRSGEVEDPDGMILERNISQRVNGQRLIDKAKC
jgi:hypothetical protein